MKYKKEKCNDKIVAKNDGADCFADLGFLPILSHMTRRIAAMMRLNSMTKGYKYGADLVTMFPMRSIRPQVKLSNFSWAAW